jgi:hypothetical protein
LKGRSFSCAVTVPFFISWHHEEGFSPTKDLLFLRAAKNFCGCISSSLEEPINSRKTALYQGTTSVVPNNVPKKDAGL